MIHVLCQIKLIFVFNLPIDACNYLLFNISYYNIIHCKEVRIIQNLHLRELFTSFTCINSNTHKYMLQGHPKNSQVICYCQFNVTTCMSKVRKAQKLLHAISILHKCYVYVFIVINLLLLVLITIIISITMILILVSNIIIYQPITMSANWRPLYTKTTYIAMIKLIDNNVHICMVKYRLF